MKSILVTASRLATVAGAIAHLSHAAHAADEPLLPQSEKSPLHGASLPALTLVDPKLRRAESEHSKLEWPGWRGGFFGDANRICGVRPLPETLATFIRFAVQENPPNAGVQSVLGCIDSTWGIVVLKANSTSLPIEAHSVHGSNMQVKLVSVCEVFSRNDGDKADQIAAAWTQLVGTRVTVYGTNVVGVGSAYSETTVGPHPQYFQAPLNGDAGRSFYLVVGFSNKEWASRVHEARRSAGYPAEEATPPLLVLLATIACLKEGEPRHAVLSLNGGEQREFEHTLIHGTNSAAVQSKEWIRIGGTP